MVQQFVAKKKARVFLLSSQSLLQSLFLFIDHKQLIVEMQIKYEKTVQCLSCWDRTEIINTTVARNESSQSISHQPMTNRLEKLSLRKNKNTRSQRFSHHPLESQLPCNNISVNYPRSQQLVIIKRQSAPVTIQRPVSNIIRNDNIRYVVNNNLRRQEFANIPHKIEWKAESQLKETTKNYTNNNSAQSQLKQTRKIIPNVRHSFEQLSRMKQSVVSICEKQEQPRVQQSAIMIDYFHPSASRTLQTKLSQFKVQNSQSLHLKPQ